MSIKTLKHKVSIIIPFFKKKKYIQQTIKSVLNQTYQNFEIFIIYDDPDRTDLSFIKKIVKKDKRIKLLINKKNLGAGLSRNHAIKHSEGKYIAFLDSDDYWKKNKLEKQIGFMEKNNFKFTHTTYDVINLRGSFVSRRIAKNFFTTEELLRSCDIGLSTVVLYRNLLNKNCLFPDLKTKEDFVLWLKILKNKVKIFGINETLANWRITEKSLSSSIFQKLNDAFKVYYYYMKFNSLKSIYYTFILSLNFLKKK